MPILTIQLYRLKAEYWVGAQSWVGARDQYLWVPRPWVLQRPGFSEILTAVEFSFGDRDFGLALRVTRSRQELQMFLSIVFQLPRPKLDGKTQRDESKDQWRHQLLRLAGGATIHQERSFVRYHF